MTFTAGQVVTTYYGCRVDVYEDGYLATRPDGEWKWFYTMGAVRRWARAR
jgi:hypothetical protein